MYRGQIVSVVDGRTADRNEVGVFMATGARQEAEVASGVISPEEAAAAAAALKVSADATVPPADSAVPPAEPGAAQNPKPPVDGPPS
jgi:hypothetical protein